MSNVIIAETKDGKLHPGTAELVTAANILGGGITVVVPAGDDSPAAGAAEISGVERVIALVGDCFATYDASSWASAIDSASPAGNLLLSASADGKDLAARLAARRSISVVQNVIAIEGGNVTYPVYSGKAHETAALSGDAVITVRANTFAPAPGGGQADIGIVNQSADVATAVREMLAKASERLDVAEANIIISGGRGMGSPDNFSQLEEIADVLGAAVGASRAAVDTWDEIPHSMQVGQTGKTVNPSLYIAVGISGAIQHLAGMRTSKYIVAINKDPEAPIFKHADYGIVATWEEVLPTLKSELQSLLA